MQSKNGNKDAATAEKIYTSCISVEYQMQINKQLNSLTDYFFPLWALEISLIHLGNLSFLNVSITAFSIGFNNASMSL